MEKEKNKRSVVNKEKMLTIGLSMALGLIIGIAIMLLAKPSKTIAKANGKSVTEKQIYDKMEKFYSNEILSMTLESVDSNILSKKYKLNDKMKEEIKENADQYIKVAEEYSGISKEEFLENYGFDTYEDFIDYLSLDYKRNLYYNDYLASLLGEERIKQYFDENNFGKISAKHILITTSEEVSSDKAKTMANEIIAKLNNGANFDEVGKEYKENNEDIVIAEDLGGLTFADGIDETFMDALKAMDDNTYSKEPVETQYGFHIIYRGQKSDLSLEDARNDVVKALSGEVEAKTLYEKLIELRNEAKLKFKNQKIKEEYDEYIKQYVND